MKTATLTDFRAKMKDHLQEIEDDQDFLVLSGPKKRDYVVLTLEQFNAMEETAHLLSTPANTSRLIESIEQDQNDQIVVRDLDLDTHVKSERKKTRTGKWKNVEGKQRWVKRDVTTTSSKYAAATDKHPRSKKAVRKSAAKK